MVKIERTRNATRNIIFGFILKIYQIIVPFIMRTAIIYLLGVQYLGLNGLFSSVLQVLNLAELGVGSAMVFSMYRPIANDEHNKICALMKLYKIYYRVIGIVIAILGCLLTPFIPKLISGSVPENINVYILYILNLSATVLSYWMFAYKNSILQAHQRNDIVSKVTLLTNTVQYGLQILVLLLFHNYYYYVIVALATQVLTNILTAIYAAKLYPEYKPKGNLPKEEIKKINQRIKDLFTAKLGGVVVSSVDTIVISAFLGLTTLAIYQNYYFVMNSICGFISVIFNAITAGIGNSLMTESDEKNYNDFKKLTFIICFILCICSSCFIGLYQPFMKLWVGESLMLSSEFVVLFSVLFYCLELAIVWATIKDAAGIWHADRFRPLIGALANLLMNIAFVQFIGLYGIILSTIISYIIISMPWLIYNLFKLLYKESVKAYLKDVGFYILIAVIACSVTVAICNIVNIEGVIGLIIKGCICVIVSFVIQLAAFHRKEEYIESKKLVKKIIASRG